jgi:Caspase domain
LFVRGRDSPNRFVPMSIVFDDRANLGDAPGMHAFVVGVSAYPHLPPYGQRVRRVHPTFGMTQLTSPALSAARFAEWLITQRAGLPRPLATCRMLLRPSEIERPLIPPILSIPDDASTRSFQREAAAWSRDVASHRDGVAVFFFCGHGVQRQHDDQLMLLDEFGSGLGGVFAGAVDLHSLFYGVAPTQELPDVARTQLYFLDTCRTLPAQFRDFDLSSASSALAVRTPALDDRRAPRFFSSLPGSSAYGIAGEPSVFTSALLRCLRGAAGDLADDIAGERWAVTVGSLARALGVLLSTGTGTTYPVQGFSSVGDLADTSLVVSYLPERPQVAVTFEVSPATVRDLVTIKVADDLGGTWDPPTPLRPHPYNYELPAGYYRIGAVGTPPARSIAPRTRKVQPPALPWKETLG